MNTYERNSKRALRRFAFLMVVVVLSGCGATEGAPTTDSDPAWVSFTVLNHDEQTEHRVYLEPDRDYMVTGYMQDETGEWLVGPRLVGRVAETKYDAIVEALDEGNFATIESDGRSSGEVVYHLEVTPQSVETWPLDVKLVSHEQNSTVTSEMLKTMTEFVQEAWKDGKPLHSDDKRLQDSRDWPAP